MVAKTGRLIETSERSMVSRFLAWAVGDQRVPQRPRAS
jgi:hypothetical protein